MRPIPLKIKKQISEDPFYKVCCITGSSNVSIEHCWSYGTKGQINELWALVPLRRDLNTSHPPKDVKDKCRLISLLRAKELGVWEQIKKDYPRHDWEQELKYLSKKYARISDTKTNY